MVSISRILVGIAAFGLMASATLSPLHAQEAQTEPDGTEQTEETTPSPEDGLETPMMAAIKLLAVVSQLDEDAELAPNGASFTIDGVKVILVFDVNADRMRLVSDITSDDGFEAEQLRRLMQANFDSALDARYAIAQGTLWSTFIHPLSSLTQDDFISGIAQTVTLVKTFGTTFTSGAFVFGGGDSNGELQKLLMEMLQDGEEI